MGPIASTALGAGKYIGLPVLAAGGLYALNRPRRGQREEMQHQVGRMERAWTGGGGLAGGLIGQRLVRGGSAPLQILGILGSAGAGAALGHELGVPLTAHHALRARMVNRAFPQGVDPRTGLPVWIGPETPTEDSLRRMHRWGY